MPEQKIIRLKNACQTLGISRTTLHRMVKRGQIQTVKLSPRCVGISSVELQRFLETAKAA